MPEITSRDTLNETVLFIERMSNNLAELNLRLQTILKEAQKEAEEIRVIIRRLKGE